MDPGQTPGQVGVFGVVAPEQTHGAGSRSLPPTPNHGGEFRRVDGTLTCYHRGGNAIAKLGSSFNASLVLSLPPTPNHGGDSQRVDGNFACYHRGNNAIAKLGSSFIANLVFSRPPSTNDGMMGGSAALAACHALERSHQHLASTMSKRLGFTDANPWVMETINAVALELQCWYQ
jgi:hypothetical protein